MPIAAAATLRSTTDVLLPTVNAEKCKRAANCCVADERLKRIPSGKLFKDDYTRG